MRVYVDTSAMAKLLVEEPESEILAAWLDDVDGELVSSELLELELRRLATRGNVRHEDIATVLEGVSLAQLDRAIVRGAGFMPMPYLRSLDALHLESALRLGASRLLTYDSRMIDAARVLGIETVSPE